MDYIAKTRCMGPLGSGSRPRRSGNENKDRARGVTLSGDETFTGWTLGVVVEYAFTDNWLGRIEYRYYGFDDEDIDGAGGIGSIDLDSQTVTVGIAYKF
jgi:outer membrane immunogenic protein